MKDALPTELPRSSLRGLSYYMSELIPNIVYLDSDGAVEVECSPAVSGSIPGVTQKLIREAFLSGLVAPVSVYGYPSFLLLVFVFLSV